MLERILQDLGTRTSKEPRARAFIQAPTSHGICKIFMQGPLRKDPTRISTRSSVKDLYRMMQGPLKKEVIRISTTACHKDLCKITQGPLKGVSKIFTGSSQKGLYKTMQEPPTGYRPRSFQHPLAPLQNVGQDLQMLRARKTAP